MNREVKKIVNEEMAALKMKDRSFQQFLNESLSRNGDTYIRSHATIINWRTNGKPPETEFLIDMLSVYPETDRRFLFALRLLAVKSPHFWGPGGRVWTLKESSLPVAM